MEAEGCPSETWSVTGSGSVTPMPRAEAFEPDHPLKSEAGEHSEEDAHRPTASLTDGYLT